MRQEILQRLIRKQALSHSRELAFARAGPERFSVWCGRIFCDCHLPNVSFRNVILSDVRRQPNESNDPVAHWGTTDHADIFYRGRGAAFHRVPRDW
jgi:hypothetical protein